MEELKRLKESGHGRYDEIVDEKLVLRTTVCVRWHARRILSSDCDTIHSSESRCVVHFYHSNFRRCKIMDKHLEVSQTQPLMILLTSIGLHIETGTKVLPHAFHSRLRGECAFPRHKIRCQGSSRSVHLHRRHLQRQVGDYFSERCVRSNTF